MQSHTIKSHADADEILTGRCKQRRKIGNNTWLERRAPDEITVRLHDTDVVVYRSDGAISLNTGGWFTVTTKARINEFSPFGVSSNRGEWSVTIRNPAYTNDYTDWPPPEPYWIDTVPFRDHMTWLNGSWTGIPTPDQLDIDRAARKKLHADIKKFVDGITPERIIQAWENTAGDCLLCRAEWAREMGMSGSDDHLAMHVEEDYFHASLMHLAVKSRNYGNPEFIMQMIYADAQRGEVSKHFCKDTLTKFLRKQLTQGVAVAA